MIDVAALSTVTLSRADGPSRESPRPIAERQPGYDEGFDWHTLFYDVYRVGPDIVFQGPPLFNLLPLLQQEKPFRGKFRWPFAKARHVSRDKRGEIWLRSTEDVIVLDGPLGQHQIAVQPNLSSLFAGRRVITTLSKDNDLRWIADWIRYYVAVHGAEGVLFYDNASSAYTTDELRRTLQSAFPDIPIAVVAWNFPYGPGGGIDESGRMLPWDSDYCQVGSLQHARFRFLTTARSVLNVDIDEMVIGTGTRSVFEAAEATRDGFIKFAGRWISAATHAPITWQDRCHRDFVLQDPELDEVCPPKWAIVPDLAHRHGHTWGVHNLFGSPANLKLTNEFLYRHMRAISTNWKEPRAHGKIAATQRHHRDDALLAAFTQACLVENLD
ncbi:hypothetical protein WBP07_30270 [Novosphingobium sp. BL-8A]|uniref:hypothetical protein n=1 Tax=Novosphingobium sp. BL-8A TaxID=3127639 RepID=UPI0037579224